MISCILYDRRMDNYSSHKSQLYCKAHHGQLFQPKAKFGEHNDVRAVTKSGEYPAHLLKLIYLSWILDWMSTLGDSSRKWYTCCLTSLHLLCFIVVLLFLNILSSYAWCCNKSHQPFFGTTFMRH